MEIVFKASHWQIVGTYVALAFVGEMIRNIDPIVDALYYVFMVSIFIGWVVMLGRGLSKRLKTSDSREFKIFMVAGILLVASAAVSRLLIVTQVIDAMGHEIALMIFWSIYVLTLVAITFAFPAKTLKRLETN